MSQSYGPGDDAASKATLLRALEFDSRQLSWITAVRHDPSVIRASRPADIASTAASRPSAHFRDGAAAAWPGTRGAAEAVAAYETAITLTRNDAERALLAERLRTLG